MLVDLYGQVRVLQPIGLPDGYTGRAEYDDFISRGRRRSRGRAKGCHGPFKVLPIDNVLIQMTLLCQIAVL